MKGRIFGDREKAMEESYFRQEDAKLLEKLRQKAPLDEIALALGQKLHVDNNELLRRVRETGVSPDAAPALFLGPLVQVAWAEGSVSKAEHKAVLRLARSRGLNTDSPAYLQLVEWLEQRPPDSIFETAVDVIKYGFSVLPPNEREERIESVVGACRKVAEASETSLSWVLGIVNTAHPTKTATLEIIASRLEASVGQA